MRAASDETSGMYPTLTTLRSKLLNVFVCPGIVFEEVVAGAPNPAHWLVPLALVILASLIAQEAITDMGTHSGVIGSMVEAGNLTQLQAATLTSHWRIVSGIAICLAGVAGTVWSAFVLWFIGNAFLKTQFSFKKALEVAGLSGTILILGAIVTSLLVFATGDVSARPSLSMLGNKLPAGNPLRPALALLDCFHLWETAILAIGLARLAAVTVRESAFWVFGYWFFFRIALALLS